MENINNFLTACETMGCKKLDLFQTVDLYEGTNPNQVRVLVILWAHKFSNFNVISINIFSKIYPCKGNGFRFNGHCALHFALSALI